MTFQIVDVPKTQGSSSESAAIVEAMLTNVGKAISVPFDSEAPNASNDLRKRVRAVLIRSNGIKKFNFKTKTEGSNLIMWLEAKPQVHINLKDGTVSMKVPTNG